MVFLKLFLRLPVVLSSSPLKILERFWRGIHSNHIHVMRNDLNWFIDGGLFCLHDRHKTDGIWNYFFRRWRTSIVAIGPGWLCLVKICIYEKQLILLKMTRHKIGPSKNYHISLSYTPGHGVSNDTKHSVVYSSHFGMVGPRIWCIISERAIFVGITSGRPYGSKPLDWVWLFLWLFISPHRLCSLMSIGRFLEPNIFTNTRQLWRPMWTCILMAALQVL